jgi:hypothetical protein
LQLASDLEREPSPGPSFSLHTTQTNFSPVHKLRPRSCIFRRIQLSLRFEAAEQKETCISPPSTTVSTILSPRTKYLKYPHTPPRPRPPTILHRTASNSTTDSTHWQLSQRAVRNGRDRRRPAQAGYTSNDVKVRRRKISWLFLCIWGGEASKGYTSCFTGPSLQRDGDTKFCTDLLYTRCARVLVCLRVLLSR